MFERHVLLHLSTYRTVLVKEFAEWNRLFLSSITSFFLRAQYFLNLKLAASLVIFYDYYTLNLNIFSHKLYHYVIG